MEPAGWVKFHRKITEWEWYDDPNTFRLFFHLVITANHADGKYRGHEIKRGQTLTGRKKLSKELNLSERQVRTSIDKLLSTNEITIKATNKFSIVTIENYSSYQSKENKNGQQNGSQNVSEKPNGSLTEAQQIATNKKKENDDNENNINKPKAKKRTPKSKTEPPELEIFLGSLSEATKKLCREKSIGQKKFKDLTESCFDHFRGKGEKKADWQAVIRNWIKNDEKFNSNKPKQGCCQQPQSLSERYGFTDNNTPPSQPYDLELTSTEF